MSLNGWVYTHDGKFIHRGKTRKEGLPALTDGDQVRVTLRQGVVTFYHNAQKVHDFTLPIWVDNFALAASLFSKYRENTALTLF